MNRYTMGPPHTSTERVWFQGSMPKGQNAQSQEPLELPPQSGLLLTVI